MTDFHFELITYIGYILMFIAGRNYQKDISYLRKHKTKARALDCNEQEKEKCGLCVKDCPYRDRPYDKNNVDYRMKLTFD